MAVTKEYLIGQIALLRDALESRRADIRDALDSILDGDGFDEDSITPQFVTAQLGDGKGEVYFDSFMTALFYRKGKNEDWEMLDEVELDDAGELVIDDTDYFNRQNKQGEEKR